MTRPRLLETLERRTLLSAADGFGLTREVWSGVAGSAVSDIPLNSPPNATGTVGDFEAPSNVGDDYGQRLSGWLTAPETGTYRFWVAGDDQVELRLSPTADPAGSVAVAGHQGWTYPREWGRYASQRSGPVHLVAGRDYYVEALAKEGHGGDNLAVGWSKPGQPDAWPSEVVPAYALKPDVPAAYADADLASVLRPGNAVTTVVNDMALGHQAKPSGIYGGWAEHPRVGDTDPPADWDATTVWGQLYNPRGGNATANTRVQLRNMQLHVRLHSTGAWTTLQDTSGIGGAFFNEDFQDDANQPADARPEAEGLSVLLPNDGGVNYHFWPEAGRAQLDLNDIAEVVTSVEGRLILDDPAGPDDRGDARLLLGTGVDWWESVDAQWDNWTTNWDGGIGRFKFVTDEWQSFNMTTLSTAEVASDVRDADYPSIGRGAGRVEAEAFAAGGQGVAFHDADANDPGPGVDLQPTADAGGGQNVGWVRGGEWLKYVVDAKTGRYDLRLRVAKATAGAGSLRVSLGGEILGTANVSPTGGWQSWKTVTLPDVDVTGGEGLELRLDVLGGGFNLNWVEFVPRPLPVAAAPSATATGRVPIFDAGIDEDDAIAVSLLA